MIKHQYIIVVFDVSNVLKMNMKLLLLNYVVYIPFLVAHSKAFRNVVNKIVANQSVHVRYAAVIYIRFHGYLLPT